MTLQILAPLHTYPDGNSEFFASQVAVVAHHLKADVHGLVTFPVFPKASSRIGNWVINVDGMAAELTAKSHSTGAAAILAMQTALSPHKISFRSTKLDCMLGTDADTAAVHAHYHDLTITEIDPNYVSLETTAEAVVFGSGRPTLLVPQKSPPKQYDHVMIAWDGSRVATRAMSDAHKFLKLAKTVTIVCVTDEKALSEESPGTKLVEYLACHSIEAKIDLVQTELWPVGETLQNHAQKIAADVMVMGAFGHSRMRDFVMGGATKGILQKLRMPVLLSH